MSRLDQLLGFLDRPGVTGVVLQTETPPCVIAGNQVKPLAKQVVSARHIAALIRGTEVEALLEEARVKGGIDAPCRILGRRYRTQIAFKSGDRVRLRFLVDAGPDERASSLAESRSAGRTRRAPGEASTAERSPDRLSAAARRTEELGGAEASVDIGGGVGAPAGVGRTGTPAVALVSAGGEEDGFAQGQSGSRVGGVVPELETIIGDARAREASDVHLSSGEPAQVRVAGRLLPVGDALSHDEVSAMVLPLLGDHQRKALEENGYADLALNSGSGVRLRVNVTRQRRGYKGCFRLVPATPSTLEELLLPAELSKITVHHQGLVVVSGPNGSGKTTTLAALVNLFNDGRPMHIITVEDPVEVVHPPKRAIISQREVHRHTKSFGNALKGALREDPDVIAIGELRDVETVEMALSAAETGHLVIATMSTPSGARTIDRLIDMFPPSVQSQVRATLAGTLKMVISQRLVPSVDGSRRFVAAELITGNVPLWTLIRDNKLYQLPSLLQRGRAYGMVRIDDSLNELVDQGKVSEDVARRFADDPRAIGAKQAPSAASPEAAVPPAAEPTQKRGGFGGMFGRRSS